MRNFTRLNVYDDDDVTINMTVILDTSAASLRCDVNVQGDNIDTTKQNIGALIDASKAVSLEVNTEKTKHMLLSRHQNAGQNHDMKIANRSFEKK
jgi:hypothetical protein